MANTLKKEIIALFAKATTVDGLKDNQVILATPIGLIFGSIASGDLASRSEIEVMNGPLSQEASTKVFSLLLKKAEDNFENAEVDRDDVYLHLTNVTIQAVGGGTYNLLDFAVFCDHITGVSIGNC